MEVGETEAGSASLGLPALFSGFKPQRVLFWGTAPEKVSFWAVRPAIEAPGLGNEEPRRPPGRLACCSWVGEPEGTPAWGDTVALILIPGLCHPAMNGGWP